MKKTQLSGSIKQFISYFCIGGISAVVEWGVFSLLEYAFNISYLLATMIAFVFSTTTNWILGRVITFKDSAYKNKKVKEMMLVFMVSLIGLGMNTILMIVFVEIVGMRTNFQKTIAKVLATCTVFIWNYLSRKLWIYKKETT